MKTTKLVMLVMTIAVALFVLIPNLSWADDGATIYKIDSGIWRGNADAIERLITGEQVAACEYYFIGLLKYSTPDLRYRWLEEGDYLSHGGLIGDELKISQFRVAHPVKLAEWKVDPDVPLGGFSGNFT